ncbi:hypothetical protein PGTUg99_007083 [Puccinia graminis f. sp. tritici]|uniref:Uncharacterized protein n=1 Tax=Puccinia graminis f. sp. tritici TaxID=56615 RepID=A0A5B0PFT0_PUCGR|nr:hypothetical protein PGTUg99_007083 [Puccinia graminis f. sp. tritici]
MVRARLQPWSTDGVDGGPSSITILLKWLATNRNYERWLGRGGESKRELSAEILTEMRRNGIHHWDYHGTRLQMTLLERSHEQAYEWEGTTGGAVRAMGVDGRMVSVRNHLLRMCPYWDELGPILRPAGDD